MLDHSQNHNKHKPDGLHARLMSSGFGGSQPKMHATEFKEGCVGPHPNAIASFYEAIKEALPETEADEADSFLSTYVGDERPEEESLCVGGEQVMIFF